MIRRSTLVLLGIFILLLVAFFLWQRYQKEEEVEITPTADQELLISPDLTVSSLRIEVVGSQLVEVERDDQGQWNLIVPEGYETDTASVDSAISQLSSLRILSEFDQGIDLGGAGLVVPVYRITASSKNGEEVVLDIGKLSPTGSGYYIRKGGKDVYIVSKYSLDSIIKLVEEPPIKPSPTAVETLSSETAPLPLSTETPFSTSTP